MLINRDFQKRPSMRSALVETTCSVEWVDWPTCNASGSTERDGCIRSLPNQANRFGPIDGDAEPIVRLPLRWTMNRLLLRWYKIAFPQHVGISKTDCEWVIPARETKTDWACAEIVAEDCVPDDHVPTLPLRLRSTFRPDRCSAMIRPIHCDRCRYQPMVPCTDNGAKLNRSEWVSVASDVLVMRMRMVQMIVTANEPCWATATDRTHLKSRTEDRK